MKHSYTLKHVFKDVLWHMIHWTYNDALIRVGMACVFCNFWQRIFYNNAYMVYTGNTNTKSYIRSGHNNDINQSTYTTISYLKKCLILYWDHMENTVFLDHPAKFTIWIIITVFFSRGELTDGMVLFICSIEYYKTKWLVYNKSNIIRIITMIFCSI